MKWIYAVFLLVSAMILDGCATMTKHEKLVYTVGAMVETLTGNAALSFAAEGRSISGSGVLMYRRPDQMRVTILTPFGSVYQEVYVSGDSVTIVNPGGGIAFKGVWQDLPMSGDLSGWRQIRWVIDIDPPDPAHGDGVVQRTNRFGEAESATFAQGLLMEKALATGNKATYDKYTVVNGVALPLEIAYATPTGEHFKIILEEPEVNGLLAPDTFIPRLENLKLHPLSSLR
jgi:outer membrane lipoprotein-sorting protein